jgi:Redoxin
MVLSAALQRRALASVASAAPAFVTCTALAFVTCTALAFVTCTALAVTGCAGTRRVDVVEVPSAPLVDEHGESVDLRRLAAGAPWTVLVFFSPGCHCLKVHEPRLVALYDADRSRGVQFVMVDSEVRGSPARDAAEAKERGYPFPILLDRGARIADAVGARYASYAVVLDATGRIHYRGGIDSDKTHLHEGATAYLEDALDALLDHREPRVAEGKTLGCALEKW